MRKKELLTIISIIIKRSERAAPRRSSMSFIGAGPRGASPSRHRPGPHRGSIAFSRQPAKTSRRAEAQRRSGRRWHQRPVRHGSAGERHRPVISATTQRLVEGWFRREWNWEVDRTHGMAAEARFIVPVCIDDAPEAGALVPEELLRAYWTRLPGGLVASEMGARFQQLIGGRNA